MLQDTNTHPEKKMSSSAKLIAQAPELRPFYVAAASHKQAKQARRSNRIPFVTEGSNIEVAKRGKSIDGLMNKIETFFSKPEQMGKLLPFLKGESKISRRFIEWFVSVYAMEHIVDWFKDGELFNVYLDYQAMMDDNTKQLFDPFCRKWRKEKRKDKKGKTFTAKIYHGIKFYYTDDEFEITTVAQLNFFKWFIGNNVLDYMMENKDELSVEMNRHNHEKKQRKKREVSRKAQNPSSRITEGEADLKLLPVVKKPSSNRKVRVQAMKRVTKRNVEVYVSFD